VLRAAQRTIALSTDSVFVSVSETKHLKQVADRDKVRLSELHHRPQPARRSGKCQSRPMMKRAGEGVASGSVTLQPRFGPDRQLIAVRAVDHT